jgi:hypothetical protein
METVIKIGRWVEITNLTNFNKVGRLIVITGSCEKFVYRKKRKRKPEILRTITSNGTTVDRCYFHKAELDSPYCGFITISIQII